MNSKIIDDIRKLIKNPFIIFATLSILLSIFLWCIYSFQLPEFYTNKELADEIAQTVTPNEVDQAVKHLLNPEYHKNNTILQIWGYSVIALIFSAIFKIKNFNNFKTLSILNKKTFVYLWINFSYIIWCIFYVPIYMIDLDKYVYNWMADSMGIPFFFTIEMLIFLGFIYFPIINILSYITYNTKIKPWFYNFLWVLVLTVLILVIIDTFSLKFTYLNLVLDFIHFVWFIFIIYAIGYTKNESEKLKV